MHARMRRIAHSGEFLMRSACAGRGGAESHSVLFHLTPPAASARIKAAGGGDVMAEQPCSGQASEAVLTAEHAAVAMYRFAALMLGSEVEALRLVEFTVAGVEIDPCADPAAAEGLVRERVVEGALEIMHRNDPASFAAIPQPDPCAPCLDDEAASPVSPSELSHLLTGAER